MTTEEIANLVANVFGAEVSEVTTVVANVAESVSAEEEGEVASGKPKREKREKKPIVIKDGDSARTYSQSNMLKQLLGWYAPQELTKSEASALISRAMKAQGKTLELSVKENNRLVRFESEYINKWIEGGCKVRSLTKKRRAS